MSKSDVTLVDLINTLRAEHLLGDDGLTYLDSRPRHQPWYICVMVGFGAWLASLLLIGFVTSFSLMMNGGYAFIGLVLIAGAILLRHRSDNDFLVQCALATSLAGQALVAYGFSASIGHDKFEILLEFALFVSSVLFLLFPDRIHRVLMVLIATGSLTTLFYVWKMNSLVPILGPVLTAALILLQRQLPNLVGSRFAVLLRPLMNGLLLSAFGVLLISTVYVLPELGLRFQFYPRPWVSTILFGGLFLYVGTWIWPTLVSPNDKASLFLYAMMVIIVICAWQAPGLLLGLIVIMLGAAVGRNTLISAGVGFFSIFLGTYFYGIEVSMLTKSGVLIATGAAILVSRWAILTLATSIEPRGPNHA